MQCFGCFKGVLKGSRRAYQDLGDPKEVRGCGKAAGQCGKSYKFFGMEGNEES